MSERVTILPGTLPQHAILAVPGDLVQNGQEICANVTLGLVGMHIIQRNPVDPDKW